jgi:hypothetical protein
MIKYLNTNDFKLYNVKSLMKYEIIPKNKHITKILLELNNKIIGQVRYGKNISKNKDLYIVNLNKCNLLYTYFILN